MPSKSSITKNTNIASSMAATMAKRKRQQCRIYKVKIDESRLSAKQKEQLKMLFVEAKWLYNDCLNWLDENNGKYVSDYIISKQITKLDKDGNREQVELDYLGSQMRQSVIADLQRNIKVLAKLKQNGYKVGKLNYRKEYKTVSLKQYGTTYKILSHNKMRIQNVHGKLTVNGLDQFINIDGIEYANANILNTQLGYYIAITTYIDKDKIQHKPKNKGRIGIDFGCTTSFTLSNGEEIDCTVQESDRLKRLQKKMFRQVKGSKGRQRTISLIRKEYTKLSNKKDDLTNKIVAYLSSFDDVIFQDEQLQHWKVKNGKAVHHSVLGRVKTKLNTKQNCHMIDMWFPTTKLCTNCGTYNDNLKLSDRKFVCPKCGITDGRDIHAAKNMIWIYDNIVVGLGRTDLKRVEMEPIVRQICLSDRFLSAKPEDTTL